MDNLRGHPLGGERETAHQPAHHQAAAGQRIVTQARELGDVVLGYTPWVAWLQHWPRGMNRHIDDSGSGSGDCRPCAYPLAQVEGQPVI
jgi:hypothetical protein